jgi:RNA polymerase sigma-70 factor (ECF subfamily)
MGVKDSDSDLARRAAAGEAAAREQLARAHGPVSFRVARSLGLDEHDAEDVAQEVMLRLFASLGRYDPARARMGTLVYRMTVNAANDLRSSRARCPAGADTTAVLSAPAPRPAPPAAGDDTGELHRAVTAAVAGLPLRQRQVCTLHDLEGLSIADTAAALELTVTNVRTHLTYARRALRQRLAGLLED